MRDDWMDICRVVDTYGACRVLARPQRDEALLSRIGVEAYLHGLEVWEGTAGDGDWVISAQKRRGRQ